MNAIPKWQRRSPGGADDALWRDRLIYEPAEVYHSRDREYLTSHRLAAFRECPLLYQQLQSGQIVIPDTPAYMIGRAAHVLILEGHERFDELYVIGGPINANTGRPYGSQTKAFAEWAAQQGGKCVLSSDQFQLIQCMCDAVHAHPLAAQLLANGVAERVLRATYCEIPCQVRLDWIAWDYGLVELKTVDNLTWFESDARRFQYVHQLAFYRQIIALATREVLPVYVIAVEKRQPYRCGVWHVNEEALEIAEEENAEAILRLRECMRTDTWPTGYESLRTLYGL